MPRSSALRGQLLTRQVQEEDDDDVDDDDDDSDGFDDDLWSGALHARLDEQGIDLDQGKNANQKNISSGGRPAKSGIPSQATRRASRLAGRTGEQV